MGQNLGMQEAQKKMYTLEQVLLIIDRKPSTLQGWRTKLGIHPNQDGLYTRDQVHRLIAYTPHRGRPYKQEKINHVSGDNRRG